MTKRIIGLTFLIALPLLLGSWGFFAHQRINYLAVFTLPPEMITFYKGNINYLTEAAVNPDRRRYAVEDEAMRHYIDIDHYGDSAIFTMPHQWDRAVALYGKDTLEAYGIVPWHIQTMYFRLREAFRLKNPSSILRLSAEIGHYIADANVPLHTTENYDGQLTGQKGIHGFWESRLPELFSEDYDFLVGRASYINNPLEEAWTAVKTAHLQKDKVLEEERLLNEKMSDQKYNFAKRGNSTVKVYSVVYSKAYHEALGGMVERQMRRSIKMVGDFWYSAWVDAGQPDLTPLVGYKPSEEELQQQKKEVDTWKKNELNQEGDGASELK